MKILDFLHYFLLFFFYLFIFFLFIYLFFFIFIFFYSFKKIQYIAWARFRNVVLNIYTFELLKTPPPPPPRRFYVLEQK